MIAGQGIVWMIINSFDRPPPVFLHPLPIQLDQTNKYVSSHLLISLKRQRLLVDVRYVYGRM